MMQAPIIRAESTRANSPPCPRKGWLARNRNRLGPPSVLVAALCGSAFVAYGVPASAELPGYEVVRADSGSNSNPARSVIASCPAGKELVGMGGEVVNGGIDALLQGIVPDLASESATVSAHEDIDGTTSNWSVAAFAVCATRGFVLSRYVAELDLEPTG